MESSVWACVVTTASPYLLLGVFLGKTNVLTYHLGDVDDCLKI